MGVYMTSKQFYFLKVDLVNLKDSVLRCSAHGNNHHVNYSLVLLAKLIPPYPEDIINLI